MNSIIGQDLGLRSVTDFGSSVLVNEIATHNSAAIRSISLIPGVYAVSRPGIYPVLSDDFSFGSGVCVLVSPGVSWAIDGLEIPVPDSLVKVISPIKDSEPLGVRTVLFGDSMTSQFYVDNTPTAVYDRNSGDLVLTSLSNPIATGWNGMVFNRNYPGMKKHINTTFEFIDSTSVKCNVGKNLDGVPNGTLAGTTFARIPTKIGSNSWFTWMQMYLGWPFDVVYNGAQSGDTTRDCLDRIDSHCLQWHPNVVFMQMPGINDTSTSNGPISDETIHRNQKIIVDKILNSGAFLVLLLVVPVFTGESRATMQNMARVSRMNSRLVEWLRGRKNVLVVDSYSEVIDVTNTSGLALSGLLKSTDNVHYSIPGAVKIATLASSKVAEIFPSSYDSRPKSAIDSYSTSSVLASSVTILDGVATFNSTAHGFFAGERVRITGATPSELNGWKTITSVVANSFTFATTSSGSVTGTIRAGKHRNLFPNPLFLTDTGGSVTFGVTGTAASGLTVRNTSGAAGGLTAVASVQNHSKYGKAQRIVCSAASADDRPGFEATPSSLFNTDLVEGREYQLEAELSISSANWANTPISEIMVRFLANVGGTLFSSFALNTYDGLPASGSLNSNQVLHLKTYPFKVPPGAITQGYFQIYVRAANTWTSNLTMELARLAVNDISQ